MAVAVAKSRCGQRQEIHKTMPMRSAVLWTGARINPNDLTDMKTHRFTLILSGIAEITPELADAMYAATNGDIELNQRDGVVYVEFDRAASTLRGAVTSAIREVEGAGVGARVVRVESDSANVIAKINA